MKYCGFKLRTFFAFVDTAPAIFTVRWSLVVGWIALLSAIQVDESLLLGGAINPWVGALYVLGVIA